MQWSMNDSWIVLGSDSAEWTHRFSWSKPLYLFIPLSFKVSSVNNMWKNEGRSSGQIFQKLLIYKKSHFWKVEKWLYFIKKTCLYPYFRPFLRYSSSIFIWLIFILQMVMFYRIYMNIAGYSVLQLLHFNKWKLKNALIS